MIMRVVSVWELFRANKHENITEREEDKLNNATQW